MIFSSTKPHRVYTSTNQDKSYPSVFNDKTHYLNSLPDSKFIEDKPLLSFTSFQHYLEDCNQNDFRKRENERLYRSANKAKTQAHFNYHQEKSNSSQAKKKHFNFTLQDEVIDPFYPCQSNPIKHRNTNSNRDIGSKSSSDNYLHKNTFVDDIFNDKYGTIEAWNSEQKLNSNSKNSQGNFVSSKRILQERKLNCILKNRANKNSQISFKKANQKVSYTQANKKVTYAEINQEKPPTIKQNLSSTKKPKNKNSSNKQNLCLTQSAKHPSTPTPQRLFGPIQMQQKQYTINNPLSSINQLQEEILLSKRKPQFLGNSSGRDRVNEESDGYGTGEVQENENIKMLKEQFEYLCSNEFDEGWDGVQKSFDLIEPSSSLKNINKQLKYFKRFPNHENKENTTCYQFGNPLKTNRPKTTQCQTKNSSSNVLKLLQSINSTTSNENCLYQLKIPIRRKQLPHTNVSTPHNIKKEDMKSISKHKQKFHESIKDRKSQSAFLYDTTFGLVYNDGQMQNDRCMDDKKENSLIITVISSFNSCDSKTKTKSKLNSKNFSLFNNRNSRLLTEEPTSYKENQNVKIQKCTSLFQKDFLPHPKQNHPLQSQNEQGYEDLRINQSMSQTIDLMHQIQDQSNVSNQQNQQSLDKLNILSQQLKKCAKMPVATKYINLANKKFTYLNKPTRLNRKKDQSENKNDKKNVIKNLNITQLEGRHIQKMRKKFDISNP